MENLDPPPPQIKDGKMARFSRAFILDLGGWGFAVPFYFVQDCSIFNGDCSGWINYNNIPSKGQFWDLTQFWTYWLPH